MAEIFWKLPLCGLVGGGLWLFTSILLDRVHEELGPIRADLKRLEKEGWAERREGNEQFNKLQSRVTEAENLISELDSRIQQMEETKEAKAKTVSANALKELVGRRS